jgi:hypothetical protein
MLELTLIARVGTVLLNPQTRVVTRTSELDSTAPQGRPFGSLVYPQPRADQPDLRHQRSSDEIGETVQIGYTRGWQG